MTLDPEVLHTITSSARSAIADEADRTQAGFSFEDPGLSRSQGSGLDRLKKQFTFLSEYSDAFIKETGVDVLIKAETAAKKLYKWDNEKKAEDKLYTNRENLPTSLVLAGKDNRLDILHAARVLPGATCSAAKSWLHAREVLGSKGHPPLSTYDMAAIGLGGCVSSKGWVEIHNPSSATISIKMFSMGSCTRVTTKDEDFPDLEDLSELKAALRVLRGAMAFVHPWNRSVDALENFFLQNSFCSKDLAGTERQTKLLTLFIDYVLGENASRWRGMEPFLNTRDLRMVWADFLSQRGSSFKQKGGQNTNYKPQLQGGQGQGQGQGQGGRDLASHRLGVPGFLFNGDICVLWNLGKCVRAPGQCSTKMGKKLRHVCNFRADPVNKPLEACEKNHMACFFHK